MSQTKSRELAPAAAVPTELMQWPSGVDGHTVSMSVGLVNTLFKGRHPFTPQEAFLFLQECKARGADPAAKDMYIIKYEAGKPASYVTSYHFLMALAQRDPNYDGFSLWFVDEKGQKIAQGLETPDTVIAAICRVKNKRRSPTEFVARMKEFRVNRPSDTNPWNRMPIHMLGKCAIGGAHRQVIGTAVHLAEEYGTTENHLAQTVEANIVHEELPPPAAGATDAAADKFHKDFQRPFDEPEKGPESPVSEEADHPTSTPTEEPNDAGAQDTEAVEAPEGDTPAEDPVAVTREQAEDAISMMADGDVTQALVEEIRKQFKGWAPAKKWLGEVFSGMDVSKLRAKDLEEMPIVNARAVLLELWMREAE